MREGGRRGLSADGVGAIVEALARTMRSRPNMKLDLRDVLRMIEHGEFLEHRFDEH
ncbi:hypothetical protein [Paracoccus sp. (in: a-proteobacteria)]|uniref:hypothetical protein n=1 Tax=Paracoccus sp. TaxID=267 RepID=UPI0035B0A8B1